MSANTVPSTRCARCDKPGPDTHRCPHRRQCLPFHLDSACDRCRAFKARQKSLFGTLPDIRAKPFLKWAGGKRQLAPQLLAHVPEYNGRYFEPFVGGGAMFYALKPKTAVLNDTNERLIRTYRAVQSDVEAVIYGLKSYTADKEFFLEMRQKPIDATPSDVEVACWLIYLNKTGFNGLYRVNRKGCFNIPYGRYENPVLCDEVTLRASSLMLRRAELSCVDFEAVVKGARKKDLVYFDPPYHPVSESSDFTAYTKEGFGLNDQIRLRDCALALKARGVHVMITNSNCKAVRELYVSDEFRIHRLQARGSIAANKDSRGARVDLLIV